MTDFTKQGWVRLHRKLCQNDLWLSEPFTKAQAWIDLFLNCNHKDGSFWIRGNEIKLNRGQIGWSELTMSARWRWSKNKTRRYLKWLETEQQIIQQKSSKTTIITILNYDVYQSDEKTIQQTIQQKDSRRYTNKNDKNDKNDKKGEEKYPSSYLKEIPKEDIKELTTVYDISESQVKLLADKILAYCESKGKTYKNYKAALRSWIMKDYKKISGVNIKL